MLASFNLKCCHACERYRDPIGRCHLCKEEINLSFLYNTSNEIEISFCPSPGRKCPYAHAKLSPWRHRKPRILENGHSRPPRPPLRSRPQPPLVMMISITLESALMELMRMNEIQFHSAFLSVSTFLLPQHLSIPTSSRPRSGRPHHLSQ